MMNSLLNSLRRASRTMLALGLIAIGLIGASAASAEEIYRGLLTNNQGALDLRAARFAFNPSLSFNKDLAQIHAMPQQFRCALRMDTVNAIPNVGDASPLVGFGHFTATFDENPPHLPLGHVSVTPNVAMANPAQRFANDLRNTALQNPLQFNDEHIVGVRETDDECRDRPKLLN
ncbi:hypothetical protein [Rhizobium sp. SSA_523]|uniref:hypothetical protein n=1 Tax=Rhizobium sp. SSA_523 TaxID=2952477 RepID=UPI0020916411|nr:hypothetical protein [Rhizobium sp. SSA_523]MCO5730249.1 hypothetical protein [Rhizobium sp. SSA_523]WKC25305.1 hypothetical protein QTJ18_15115 [Rhizobium sp. SSA_523]